MIGCLIGEVFALEAPTVLLNVNGVGYEVDTPLSTFCQLQKGQKVTLWTHLAVREDAQLLYGFLDAQEKPFSAPCSRSTVLVQKWHSAFYRL